MYYVCIAVRNTFLLSSVPEVNFLYDQENIFTFDIIEGTLSVGPRSHYLDSDSCLATRSSVSTNFPISPGVSWVKPSDVHSR